MCGVCGRNLSDEPSLSLDQATRILESPARFERITRSAGVVGILVGILVIGLGVLSLFAEPLGSITFQLGLVMFPLVLVMCLIGLFSIVVGMSSLSRTSRLVIKKGFSRGGPIMRPSSGSGWEHSYRESERETAEGRRKETGDAD